MPCACCNSGVLHSVYVLKTLHSSIYETFHGLIRTYKWPASNVSGFVAQLVRASHRYCEVGGSNPVEAFTFSGFYKQLHNCAPLTICPSKTRAHMSLIVNYNYSTSYVTSCLTNDVKNFLTSHATSYLTTYSASDVKRLVTTYFTRY